MEIQIFTGIYADHTAQLRTSLPRNMVPVPKSSGASKGYLAPAPGLKAIGTGGPGIGRGGINWNGAWYSVMGTKLVSIASDGAVAVLGEVGAGATVSLDYSFDRMAIASAQKLFYWDGTALTQVTDPDLGIVVDMIWIDGFFMTTDGTFIIVTELNDPYSVNPLKYGSSESDPDPIVALKKVREEVMALNRYTIESFQNNGGANFPFQRIDGAQIQRGCIGTHACAKFLESVAFLGSGRNESPAVWIAGNASAQKLSTREIDTILLNYTEAQLSQVLLETRTDKGQQLLYMHLPDRTMVFDGSSSELLGDPVWFELGSSIIGPAQYRARNFVWAHDQWGCTDPQSVMAAVLIDSGSTHYGKTIGWDFGTPVLYNESNGAIINDMEMVCLPGNVPLGDDPVVWTSYSLDGQTWSQEKPVKAGKTGELQKRIAWRRQGHLRNMRFQRFRGTSDAYLSVVRLNMDVEPLAY